MKAILRDQKGWTKTMTIPYAMAEIRLPLHRKLHNYFEVHEGAFVTTDRTTDMVIFRLSQKGLNDNVVYYDEDI